METREEKKATQHLVRSLALLCLLSFIRLSAGLWLTQRHRVSSEPPLPPKPLYCFGDYLNTEEVDLLLPYLRISQLIIVNDMLLDLSLVSLHYHWLWLLCLLSLTIPPQHSDAAPPTWYLAIKSYGTSSHRYGSFLILSSSHSQNNLPCCSLVLLMEWMSNWVSE